MATINGTNNNDNLSGTSGDDAIEGRNGADTLSGLGGRDKLKGGNGNDVLYGGNHADTLIGGDGRDTFVFSQSGLFDTIKDFDPVKDTIVFQFDGIVGASWNNTTDMLSVVYEDLPGDPVVLIDGGGFTFDNFVFG